MAEHFDNRQDWFTPALALLVWSAHFSVLWAASSVLPGDPAARIIAGLATLVALAAFFLLWRRAGRPGPFTMPGLGLAIALAGTGFSAMAAIVG